VKRSGHRRGSWGTALANLLAKKGIDVTIWSFEADVAAAINSRSTATRAT
jgi:glycerol-3-phosphate dehydrogenase (NAD(P)+)